jgi:hypothetical protein
MEVILAVGRAQAKRQFTTETQRTQRKMEGHAAACSPFSKSKLLKIDTGSQTRKNGEDDRRVIPL